MKPDALVMGICHPTKLNYLNQSLDSYDQFDNVFDKKMLAIDQFNGHVFPEAFKTKFSNKNWQIIIDNHKSRSKSILNGLNSTSNEWVFYNEDDIVMDLPKNFDFSNFLVNNDGRKPGMFSLTFGGTKHDLGKNDTGDMAYAETNVIFEDDELICFRRIESMKDDFFFEFPGLFIRTDLFISALTHSMKNNQNQQIEFALSRSWFELQLDKEFYKASILRKSFLSYRNNDAMDILHKGRFFNIIDPLQGHFAYGGNTNV